MKTKIYVPDIECESCVKLISRKFKDNKDIHDLKFNDDNLDITHSDSLKPESIINTVKSAGFRASLNPFERKTISERIRHFREHKTRYVIELTSLKYSVLIFAILSVLEIIAYFGFFMNVPNFIQRYIWWLAYLNLSIATIGSALWHYLAYKGKVTCMTGMMIGMIIGMQAGMMIGSVLGATNGFFVGAMAGMIIGCTVGAMAGMCCGVMGVLQGMMAGLMGGTMGPMIPIMMFSDNLLWFMPFYMAVNVFILWGFSYMVLEEIAEGKDVERKPIDFTTFAAACVIAASILIVIMIYGLRSAVVAV